MWCSEMQKLWNMQTLEEWTGACRIETFLKPKKKRSITNHKWPFFHASNAVAHGIERLDLCTPRAIYIFPWLGWSSKWSGFRSRGRALDAHAHLGGERNVENNIAAVSFGGRSAAIAAEAQKRFISFGGSRLFWMKMLAPFVAGWITRIGQGEVPLRDL